MRRLVGLIALLALIYGAWWLTQNDFDLRKVPILGDVINEIRGPEPESDTAAAPEAGEVEAESSAALMEQADSAASSGSGAGEGTDGAAMAPEGQAAPGADMASGSDAPAAETETAMVDPGAGESEAEAPVTVPSFDIVRVEPTGETVLAGVAEPLAMVEVLNGVEPVATAEANERGEWALVLEEPLPPGTHDLGIRTTSPDQSKVTLSDQRVAVSVPETPDEEPLVVLNVPDAPSRIIQVPAEGEKETEIAAAPQAGAAGESAMAPPPAPETAAAAMEGSTQEGEVAAAAQEATPETSASGETAAMATASEEKVSTTEAPPAAAETAASTETAESAAPDAMAEAAPSAASEMAVAQPDIAAPEDAATSASESAGAAAEPSETEVAAAPVTAGQSGESETPGAAEGDAMMSAEGAEPPMVGDEQPASGARPSEPTEMAAAAPADEEAASAPEGHGVSGGAPAAEGPPAIAPPAPEVGVAAVEAETNGALYIAGTATTSEPVRVYVDDEFIGEATPTEGGTWLLETTREMAPAEYTIRADQVDSGGGVIARAEVPFEREIEVASLKTTGESVEAGTGAVAGRVAPPETVIIKRGDNLWRISRKLYGYGIRYSTIYQANRDQIRNPDLIYPGQVFVLPTGDTNWDERE